MHAFLQVGELGLPQVVKGTQPGNCLLPEIRGKWGEEELYFKFKGGGSRQSQVKDTP